MFRFIAVYRFLPHFERSLDEQQIDEIYFSLRTSSLATSALAAAAASKNNNNNNNNNNKLLKNIFHTTSADIERTMPQPHQGEAQQVALLARPHHHQGGGDKTNQNTKCCLCCT